MNIYGLLKADPSIDMNTLGNEYLRLLKCYEFVLNESTEPDVRSIMEEKYNTVLNMKGEAPQPFPRVYSGEKGVQQSYLEALKQFDEFKSISEFNNAVQSLGNALTEEPRSVMNIYLSAAVSETIKYLEENPDALY